MTEQLFVQFGRELVGTLRRDVEGRFCLAYAPAWIDRPGAFPISLSLPLLRSEYVGGLAHSFFANLLPEGAARQAVCRRLGLSETNDFGLLRAIGGECAGALSITERRVDPIEDAHYELLDDHRIQQLISDRDIVPLLIGGASTRLSLAGAQDKLPVTVLDGKLHLPLHASVSTHILKLPNPRYSHLPANEAFVMGLARRVELDAVDAKLWTRTDPPSLLVERYDRLRSEDSWPATRLHQEDLCQALGLPPEQKYEQEGGPSLANAIEVIRTHVRRPLADVARLLEWQAFNVVVGNADGHGKNLSILYEGTGTLRLAPFYDLLSTRQYSSLDRLLAMSVGGQRDMDHLQRRDWHALATSSGIAPRVAMATAVAICERVLDVLPAWRAEFRDTYGDLPVLQRLPRWISRSARRLMASLEG
ncbi:MAG: type II toxin-antitoxin system HipA family toxin [Kofleriaceae bacterium]